MTSLKMGAHQLNDIDYEHMLSAIDAGTVSEKDVQRTYNDLNRQGQILEAGEIRGRYYTKRNNAILIALSGEISAILGQNKDIIDMLAKLEETTTMPTEISELKEVVVRLASRVDNLLKINGKNNEYSRAD